jgi:hypothetical protein
MLFAGAISVTPPLGRASNKRYRPAITHDQRRRGDGAGQFLEAGASYLASEANFYFRKLAFQNVGERHATITQTA